jgi:hypothetical protein
VETNPPRYSQLELINSDERQEWTDSFPVPRKTHPSSCRAAAT